MSRFHKIFLASVLVIIGFGVAKFLGQPVLPLRALDVHDVAAQPALAALQATNSNPARAAGSVRLLPDTPTTRAAMPAINTVSGIPEPPAIGAALGPVLAVDHPTDGSTMPPTDSYVPIASAPVFESATPRARLRNEAPLPVGIDPHSPATIRRMPPTNPGDKAAEGITNEQSASVNWPAPQLMNVGYSDAGGPPSNSVTASFNAPVQRAAEDQVAPPPWPAPQQNAEPETHIVVDGDSLEKLAGRYLSDPRRSREIYEMNRDVLPAPDLLPIGAELKIPERSALASASWNGQSFQPNSAKAISNRAPDLGNLIPVQPASLPQGIIPRAQLSSPVMVQ